MQMSPGAPVVPPITIAYLRVKAGIYRGALILLFARVASRLIHALVRSRCLSGASRRPIDSAKSSFAPRARCKLRRVKITDYTWGNSGWCTVFAIRCRRSLLAPVLGISGTVRRRNWLERYRADRSSHSAAYIIYSAFAFCLSRPPRVSPARRTSRIVRSRVVVRAISDGALIAPSRARTTVKSAYCERRVLLISASVIATRVWKHRSVSMRNARATDAPTRQNFRGSRRRGIPARTISRAARKTVRMLLKFHYDLLPVFDSTYRHAARKSGVREQLFPVRNLCASVNGRGRPRAK